MLFENIFSGSKHRDLCHLSSLSGFCEIISLQRSHIPEARWWVVHAVDKKRARLNMIDHLLKQFPYTEVHKSPIVLPQRERHEHYSRQAVPEEMLVPEVY